MLMFMIAEFLGVLIGVMADIQGTSIEKLENYVMIYPTRVSSDGTDLRSWDKGVNKQNAEDLVHYKIRVEGKDEIIDLKPNQRLVSPAAISEIGGDYYRNQLGNLTIRKIPKRQCIYEGKVRNYNDSSSALVTCSGLNGLIRIRKNNYFIEPFNTPNNKNATNLNGLPHVLYKTKDISDRINCATEEEANTQNVEKINPWPLENNSLANEKNELNDTKNKALYLDTLVAVDRLMMSRHPTEVLDDYALTILNIAQLFLHGISTKVPLNLRLVRLVKLGDEQNIINQRIKKNAMEKLESFSEWQSLINPVNKSHPNHHDLAVFITGNDICNNEGNCHFIGITKTNGICQPKQQAVMCKDTGLTVGYTLAHEIALCLGIEQVTGKQKRNPENSSENRMSSIILMNSYKWKNSSQDSLQRSIKRGIVSCLRDQSERIYNYPNEILPGMVYGNDFQCKKLLNENAKGCYAKGICQGLRCQFDDTPCSNTGVIPVQGTLCDENKWCVDGECIEVGESPEAIHGEWNAWTEWSPCSRTCGIGVSTSTRECNRPAPWYGGRVCEGRRKRHKTCSIETCPIEAPSFRDVQCSSFNSWLFPGDSRMHKWEGFFTPNGEPCILFCKNENNVVAPLAPKVIDGTTCNRDIRDICVDGKCRNLPCDYEFDSESIEDACGVCHGGGTSCEIDKGVTNITNGGTKQCCPTIPRGARNIKLEVKYPVNSHFFVKSENCKEPFNKRNKLGMFHIPNGIAWLGVVHPNKEILNIPGPTTQPLTIWASTNDPQLVSYSMSLPSPPREGKYKWEYSEWKPCAAQCGKGVQYAEPQCFESLSGQVENKFCKHIEKPPRKKRSCATGICNTRWLTGEWQECGPCPSHEAKQFRLVQCVMPISGAEEGVNVVHDKKCKGSKPASSQNCSCLKRQAGYWPPHYKTYLPDFKQTYKRHEKGQVKRKMPEKKITLMQLENESEVSMLKQLKENQNKHTNPSIYLPVHFGGNLNISFPFRKKRTPPFFKESNLNFHSLNEKNIKELTENINEKQTGDLTKGSFEVENDHKMLRNILSKNNYTPRHISYYPENEIDMNNFNHLPNSEEESLNFPDSTFKLLSQNIPQKSLRKQQIMQNKEKLEHANSENLLPNEKNWNELIRILTLFKALQMQSCLNKSFKTNEAYVNPYNLILQKTPRKHYENISQAYRVSPFFHIDSLGENLWGNIKNTLDIKERTTKNAVQLPYNIGSVNDNLIDIVHENKKTNNNIKTSDNEIIYFPTEDELKIKNKLIARDKLSSVIDKILVEKVNINLKFLPYIEKLKLYEDLNNITNTLFSLISLETPSENCLRNHLDWHNQMALNPVNINDKNKMSQDPIGEKCHKPNFVTITSNEDQVFKPYSSKFKNDNPNEEALKFLKALIIPNNMNSQCLGKRNKYSRRIFNDFEQKEPKIEINLENGSLTKNGYEPKPMNNKEYSFEGEKEQPTSKSMKTWLLPACQNKEYLDNKIRQRKNAMYNHVYSIHDEVVPSDNSFSDIQEIQTKMKSKKFKISVKDLEKIMAVIEAKTEYPSKVVNYEKQHRNQESNGKGLRCDAGCCASGISRFNDSSGLMTEFEEMKNRKCSECYYVYKSLDETTTEKTFKAKCQSEN